MNQILKIKSSLSALTLVTILLASSDTFAQGNFAPLRNSANASSQTNQWEPPTNTQAPTNNHRPVSNVIPSSSFPSEPHAFDPGIRTAKLEVPANVGAVAVDASVESTLDSTASMFANLKSSAGDKVSGFMAAFNQGGSWSNKLKSLTGSADIGKMLGSLALVLGIYFAFVWVMRKINPNGGRGLPPEVIEVLGQVPFGTRRSLQLVRLGSKLLLLMNSPEGTQPIGEITDPTEVEYLASLCPGKNKKRSNSVGMIGSGTSGSTNQGSTNQGSSNHIAAIQQAARNLVAPNNASTNAGASTTADSSTNSSNLANILRTLEQAAKPNGTVFEA